MTAADDVHPPGLPEDEAAVRRTAERCRHLLRRRALASSAVSLLPLPGLDLLVDLTVLSKLFADINAEFGLTPAQIARLAPRRQERVYKAVMAVGSALIGKIVTHELVAVLLRRVGLRLTTSQVARFVPVLGQAASAALSYSALRYVGEQHIRNCMRVSELLIELPAPPRK